jgi:hypothetical protein
MGECRRCEAAKMDNEEQINIRERPLRAGDLDICSQNILDHSFTKIPFEWRDTEERVKT